ncbi:hypothetical protein [Amycolatopsis lexingtonensis]|uniref:hypothetical protein n=1 Tax=Amycolatopsis lexingtonensis TaxID=218822 RepID=UPI003F6EBEDF
MLIEESWKPGVWIDGDPSSNACNGGAIGTFAHLVHDDLLAARAAGRVAAHVETTISASIIRPLWGDEPPIWLVHIRFTGIADSLSAPARAEVTTEALASLDRHGREQVPLDMVDRYAGRLFFVDEEGNPQYSRAHHLRAS